VIEEAEKIINEVEALGGMAKAVTDGMPKRRIEESAAMRQAKIDSGEEVLVGVNKYALPKEDKLDVRKIDNTAVRTSQIEKIKKVKKSRDQKLVAAALNGITNAANNSNENLLDLAIKAARVRCTVGEISDALERIYGRYKPVSSVAVGVYRSSYNEKEDINKVADLISAFTKKEGRPPRILVAKVGQDGHDRGAKVIASGFSDLGFDCDIGPLFSTPQEVAQQAIDSDVHVLGVSSQAAGHRTLVPEIIAQLKKQGRGDIIVVCGGVIPEEDYEFLYKAGVSLVFGPGTKIPVAAQKVLSAIPSSGK